MNTVALAFAVLGLATVAAAGVVAGFVREAPPPFEPVDDPLDDRRRTLARSIADLDDARASGALDEDQHRKRRADAEARLARVLAAVDRRAVTADTPRAGPAASVVPAERPAGTTRTEPRRVPAWAVGVLVVGTVGAIVAVSLARDARPSAPPAAPPSDDALAFFERRVEQHPDDLAARLDLAHRYLDAGRIDDSLEQYRAALVLDPDDAEANAHVGMVLHLSDRPRDALGFVDRALATDPDYPEALFFRGVILLRGLDHPQAAIDALEGYLDAAPFGAERNTARDLIAEARAALRG